MSGAADRARTLLCEARRVVVVTGAGISAESGVPTFRGEAGLWKTYRPEDLATPEAFRRDPRLVWEWYAWRRGLMAACRPNDGHRALARFALDARRDVTLVTQNVDALHQEAARDAARAAGLGGEGGRALPLTLHGSIFRDRCSRCGVRAEAGAAVDASSEDTLPRCGRCDGLLRPDVVWYGEALDLPTLQRAFEAAEAADVCLAVGTSGVVHPAASIPVATVRAGGALVEVDPAETALTRWATVSVRGGAAQVLPGLLA